MALKKLKWLKYLFIGRTEGETEQNYWNEKRKKHLANEHSDGIAVGLDVTETTPASLSVEVAAGRAIDSQGNDPEIESVQEMDLASLVPATGTRTVYITLKYNEVEVEPYFVDEIGDYQNKYVQDSYQLEATTSAPSAPAVELARVVLSAGATVITDAADPKNPQTNEIDLRYRKHSGKETLALRDLSDVDEDEADAFNGMENPSAANPITTVSKADSIVAPVRDEVVAARGTKPSLDSRLDVMLNNDGSFKGITRITPAAPLTGGGTAGDVPLGISNATPTSDGAMSAADKAKLDSIDPSAGGPTPQEILTALKTVDGTGSGLDADLLDGVEHRGKGGLSEHPAATAAQGGFMSAGDKSRLDELVAPDGSIKADTINEKTTGAGVTVDGVLHKDGKLAESHVGFDTVAGHNHDGVGSRAVTFPDGTVTLAKLKMAQGNWNTNYAINGATDIESYMRGNYGLRVRVTRQDDTGGGSFVSTYDITIPQYSHIVASYVYLGNAYVKWDYHTN